MSENNQKPVRHWMVDQQSFVDLDVNSYRIAPEPAIIEPFLDAKIKEKMVWKTMVPLYYQAITRTPRSRLRDIPRFYDPLIRVKKDSVSFTMRATDNRQFWNMEFFENVFVDSNFEKGSCFVDFNINFIQQIRSLKKRDVGYLLIDETGLEYASNTENSFLPNEDRGALIKLLQQVEDNFDAEADQELEFDTADAYNRRAINGVNGQLFDTYQTSNGSQQRFTSRRRRGWGNQIDRWGAVYNPFYIFRSSTRQFKGSRISSYLEPKVKVKFWEETDEYLIEVGLRNTQKQKVGVVRLFTTGRVVDRPTDNSD